MGRQRGRSPRTGSGRTGRRDPDRQADQAEAPTTQFDRMLELEEAIDSTVDEVDDILLMALPTNSITPRHSIGHRVL